MFILFNVVLISSDDKRLDKWIKFNEL